MKLYHELAEYYFAIEENHRDIEQDIHFIRSLLLNMKSPAVLDLCCGTGEHVSRLSKYGISCCGLDNSGEMLAIAKKRSPEKVRFIKGDITTFDFYNEFDLIISLFGSLDYLLEDAQIDKAFWNIWRALKDEGRALLEIWNASPVRAIGTKAIAHVSTTPYENLSIKRERGFHLINPQNAPTIVEVNYRYTLSGNGDEEVLTDRHTMRSYTVEEITPFITENGLAIEHIYGNVTKAAYTSTCNKMVLLLKKQ